MKLCEVQVSYKPARASRPKVQTSRDGFGLVDSVFNMDTLAYQEQFIVLLLNRSNRVIGYSVLSTGSQSATCVDIKMLAQRAILTHAAGVMLMHNHPSGAVHPSPQDDELTQKIRKALELFEIRVLDHIIVGGDCDEYYSYTDKGRL